MENITEETGPVSLEDSFGVDFVQKDDRPDLSAVTKVLTGINPDGGLTVNNKTSIQLQDITLISSDHLFSTSDFDGPSLSSPFGANELAPQEKVVYLLAEDNLPFSDVVQADFPSSSLDQHDGPPTADHGGDVQTSEFGPCSNSIDTGTGPDPLSRLGSDVSNPFTEVKNIDKSIPPQSVFLGLEALIGNVPMLHIPESVISEADTSFQVYDIRNIEPEHLHDAIDGGPLMEFNAPCIGVYSNIELLQKMVQESVALFGIWEDFA